MPNNHCSNWEYHNWLKEKGKKKSIEATLFYCIKNNDSEDYFIGLSTVNELGLMSPFCKINLDGDKQVILQEDGKKMRKLINLIIKKKPKPTDILDFRNERFPI